MAQGSGPKLLTLVRRAIRLRHYSRHTEEAYVAWVRRVEDMDFGRGEIVVRRGKGARDRVTMLPGRARRELAAHLERVERRYRADLLRGAGYVELPGGLGRKLPGAGRKWVWQWV